MALRITHNEITLFDINLKDRIQLEQGDNVSTPLAKILHILLSIKKNTASLPSNPTDIVIFSIDQFEITSNTEQLENKNRTLQNIRLFIGVFAPIGINALGAGTTQLGLAVKAENVAVVDELLKCGAEPITSLSQGLTQGWSSDNVPEIILAVSTNSVQMTGLLLQNVNYEQEVLDMVLFGACYSDSYDVIPLLVKKGARINKHNRNGDTPLMIASRKNLPRLVRVLLKHGADRTLTNNQGETAFDIASEQKNIEIRDLGTVLK